MKKNDTLRKSKTALAIIITLAVIIFIMTLTIDKNPHDMIIEEDIIKIQQEEYQIKDINSIKIIEEIEDYSLNGAANDLFHIRGKCKINEEDIQMYIYKNKSPYIEIKLNNTKIIYNQENRKSTLEDYEKLEEYINK